MAKYKYGDIRVYAKSYLCSMLYTKPRRARGNGLIRACLGAVRKALCAAGRLIKSPFSLIARRRQERKDRLYGPFSPFYSPAPALELESGETIPIAPEEPERSVSARWVWGLLSGLMACAGLVAMVGATAASGHAEPAYSVILSDDAKTAVTLTSRASTVGDMLAEAGIQLAEGDEVQPGPDTPLSECGAVRIDRANTVYVSAGELFTELTMANGTVREALAMAGVSYDQNDLVSPEPYVPIEQGMRIEVVAVDVAYEVETQDIAYKTITQKDDTLEEGKTRVAREGQAGVKNLKYRVVYHDGEEAERELLEQTVSRHAVDELILEGTKVVDRVVSVAEEVELRNDTRADKRPPKESEIEKIVYVEATAYTHTGKTTATGTMPKVGTIAVNPKQIPYGTRMYIEGYGYGVAEDTGAFRHTDRFQIDLFMDTVRECLRWGRKQKVKVYILK